MRETIGHSQWRNKLHSSYPAKKSKTSVHLWACLRIICNECVFLSIILLSFDIVVRVRVRVSAVVEALSDLRRGFAVLRG